MYSISNGIFWGIIFLLVVLIIFLVIRQFWLWYWGVIKREEQLHDLKKIIKDNNEILEKLLKENKSINKKMEKIIDENNGNKRDEKIKTGIKCDKCEHLNPVGIRSCENCKANLNIFGTKIDG